MPNPTSAHRGFLYRYRRYKDNTFFLEIALFTRIVELLLHFPAGDERHETIDKPRQKGGEKTYQKIGCHDLIIFSGGTHIRFLKPD